MAAILSSHILHLPPPLQGDSWGKRQSWLQFAGHGWCGETLLSPSWVSQLFTQTLIMVLDAQQLWGLVKLIWCCAASHNCSTIIWMCIRRCQWLWDFTCMRIIAGKYEFLLTFSPSSVEFGRDNSSFFKIQNYVQAHMQTWNKFSWLQK